jgi:flavin reductase (DIM6/NTAB) family NADH-FMN oxidoreductase RutF
LTRINQGAQNVLSVVFIERQVAQMQAELAKAMKAGMRRLAAGVCIISAVDDRATRYAMTVSSVTSVSDAPPSLLVCINTSARICPVLSVGKTFAVNVLEQQHTDVSIVCSRGDQGDKRFDLGHWATSANALPILADAAAVFECRIEAVHPFGTHHIVIGKITAATVSASPLDPLIYCDGSYRKLMD